MSKIIAMDCETTGKHPSIHGMIEASFLFIDDFKIVDKYSTFMSIYPDQEIDPEALKVNKTDKGKIMEYRKPEDAYVNILAHFDAFIDQYDRRDKAYFLAYRGNFDLSFLVEFFTRNNNPYLGSYINWKVLDPLLIVHLLQFLGKLPILDDCKLLTLCEHFDIAIDAHSAESDIMAAWDLFRILMLRFSGQEEPLLSRFRVLRDDLKRDGAAYAHSLVNIAYELQLVEQGKIDYNNSLSKLPDYLDSMAQRFSK